MLKWFNSATFPLINSTYTKANAHDQAISLHNIFEIHFLKIRNPSSKPQPGMVTSAKPIELRLLSFRDGVAVTWKIASRYLRSASICLDSQGCPSRFLVSTLAFQNMSNTGAYYIKLTLSKLLHKTALWLTFLEHYEHQILRS